jgi:hypothetical protein
MESGTQWNITFEITRSKIRTSLINEISMNNYLNTVDGSTFPMKIRGQLFSDLPGWDS